MVKKTKTKKKKASGNKRTKKKPAKKTATIKSTTKVDKKLIENFVALQKVLVNLSLKIESLSSSVEKLLNIFEISAKSIAQNKFNPASSEETKDIQNKLNNMMEQNKLIARGLTLMHEGGPRPAPIPPQKMPRQMPPPRPRPAPQQRKPVPQKTPSDSKSMQGYEKSLTASDNPQFKKLKKSSGDIKSIKDKI